MNKYRNKIALIIPWYGSFPWYWKFFVHSMKYNPSIDCFIITDEKLKEELPSNIKIVNKTLKELKELIEIKLGFAISLDYAYKLCDFKPTYGFIFEELLSDYDFWAHGDIDLMFGNIRNFITDYLLDEHDIISVRRDYLTGYFLLFRNSPTMNRLFTKSKDYRMVFQSSQNWCFDECNHMHQQIYGQKKNILDVDCHIESMEHIVQQEVKEKNIRASYNIMAVEGTPGHIKWENGLLSYKGKYEILLYHFIAFKSSANIYIPKWNSIPDTILIEDSFITSLSENKIAKTKLQLNLTIDRLRKLIKKRIRVDFLGRFISSPTIKKGSFKSNDFVGDYKMNNSSILYGVYFADQKLFVRENSHSNLPLYHLWANTFITPDFRTIVRGRKKGKEVLLKMDSLDSKNSWLRKVHTS